MKPHSILHPTLTVVSILACTMFLPLKADSQAQLVTSYKSSKDVIANPDRGLYFYGGEGIDHSNGCWANYPTDSKLTFEKLVGIRARGLSLIYLQYDLGTYREKYQIESRFIDCIRTDFSNIRAAGLKVIL